MWPLSTARIAASITPAKLSYDDELRMLTRPRAVIES